MNPYFTDLVDIVTVTHDANGAESVTVRASVSSRVSEKHKLVVNQKGEEVYSSMEIWLEAGFDVDYTSRVRVRSICGVAYSTPLKEWQIQSISNAHGFSAHHITVWL